MSRKRIMVKELQSALLSSPAILSERMNWWSIGLFWTLFPFLSLRKFGSGSQLGRDAGGACDRSAGCWLLARHLDQTSCLLFFRLDKRPSGLPRNTSDGRYRLRSPQSGQDDTNDWNGNVSTPVGTSRRHCLQVTTNRRRSTIRKPNVIGEV
jgi:hypothetical protein